MGIDLMKKLLVLATLLAIGSEALADGNSLVMIKRRPDDSGQDQVIVAPPTVSSILYQNVSDFKPALLSLGSNLDLSNGVLSVTGMPAAQLQSDWNQANTSALDYVKNKPTIPSIPTRSFSYPTRALNTCYQISATRDAAVSYSVEFVTVSTLVSGQGGTVFLELFTDSACTLGTQEIMRASSSNTQSLGISVTMTQIATGTLTGTIPAGAYVKQRTANTTSTPTYTARPGQEVLQ